MNSDFFSEFSELAGALDEIGAPIVLKTFEWPVLAGNYAIKLCVDRRNMRYAVKFSIGRVDGEKLDGREQAIAKELTYLIASMSMPNAKAEGTISQRQFETFYPNFCARGERAACVLKTFSDAPFTIPKDPDCVFH